MVTLFGRGSTVGHGRMPTAIAYGLIRDDIHTQIKTLKKSGHWFNELSNKNSFE